MPAGGGHIGRFPGRWVPRLAHFIWCVPCTIRMVTLSVANLCVAGRLPPIKASNGIFGSRVFRNPPFAVYCAAPFVVSFGSFTVLIYIGSSAVAAGISRNFAFYWVAIINASSGVGRVLCGLLGDRLGAMNPHCHSATPLTVLSVFYGLINASYTALNQVPAAAMGRTEYLGLRICTVNTVIDLGMSCHQ
ncbi:hypothetical protein B0H14DRAFT_3532385 [Mycena olivaceomarginata]|nr:hypothetical protein B0H14DRAFT_3532385 [Mycena olivaceomarginata]